MIVCWGTLTTFYIILSILLIHQIRDPNGDGEHSGLKSSKYVFESNALDNGQTVEKNKCFCRKGECLSAGLIDVTDCYYGFPIALSYPHFMESDPVISERISGLTPNHTEHHSFFHIQPVMSTDEIFDFSLNSSFLYCRYISIQINSDIWSTTQVLHEVSNKSSIKWLVLYGKS